MGLSDETRKKISESARGRSPWNKGKSLPKDVKAKISSSSLKSKEMIELVHMQHILQTRLTAINQRINVLFAEEQTEKSEGLRLLEEYANVLNDPKGKARILNTERQRVCRDRKNNLLPLVEVVEDSYSAKIKKHGRLVEMNDHELKWDRNLKAGKLNPI